MFDIPPVSVSEDEDEYDEFDPHTCPRCGGPLATDGTCDCIDDSDRNYLHPKNKLRYNKILTLYGFKRTRLPNEGKE